MKLKELIKELQEYPEDFEVIIDDGAGWTDVFEIVKTTAKVHRKTHYNYYHTQVNDSEYDNISYEEQEVIMLRWL